MEGLKTSWWLVVWLLACHWDIGSTGSPSNKRQDFPAYGQIQATSPQSFKIEATDCVFKATGGLPPCKKVFNHESGSCSLEQVISQLFPGVNIATVTNQYIAPNKLWPKKISSSECSTGGEKGTVKFVSEQRESFQVIPTMLSMAPNAEITLTWKKAEPVSEQNIKVAIAGKTSIGTQADIDMKIESDDGKAFTTVFKMQTFELSEFYHHFNIDIMSAQAAYGIGVQALYSILDAMRWGNTHVTGVISPGAGFELVAEGKEEEGMFAEAKRTLALVQSFQRNVDSPVTEHSAVVGALFAIFDGESYSRHIVLFTRKKLLPMPFFLKTSDHLISISTGTINSFNTAPLQSALSKYIPKKSFQAILKGFSLLHLYQNNDPEIKNQDNEMLQEISFYCAADEHAFTWTSPMLVEGRVGNLKQMISSGMPTSVRIPVSNKVSFVNIKWKWDSNVLRLNFNLTEPFAIGSSGIINLKSSTIGLYTRANNIEHPSKWQMGGSGREVIADKLVDVKIVHRNKKPIFEADTNLFSAHTVYDRLKAKPLPDDQMEQVKFLSTFLVNGLRYSANLLRPAVLRLIGKMEMTGNPYIEIIHITTHEVQMIKIGILFKKVPLYNIINEILGRTLVKTTWLCFKQTALVINQFPAANTEPFAEKKLNKINRERIKGISFFGKRLMVRNCDDWKACEYLRNKGIRGIKGKFVGKLSADGKALATTPVKISFHVANGVRFAAKSFSFRSDDKGDLYRLEGEVAINIDDRGTKEIFSCRIVATNANTLKMKIGDRSQESSKLLKIPVVKMKPVFAKFRLAVEERPEWIVFRSSLVIGSSEGDHLEFTNGQQYVKVSDLGVTDVKIVGIKTGEVALSDLLKMIDPRSVPHELLQDSKFKSKVVLIYTTQEEAWEVPEYDIKVTKGYYLVGYLTLKTGETYKATVKLVDDGTAETVLELNPIKFGKVQVDENGKVSYKSVRAFLFKSKGAFEKGPELTLSSRFTGLKGYCSTIGIEGPFSNVVQGDMVEFTLTGSVYGETDINTLVSLQFKFGARLSEGSLLYSFDLSRQAEAKVQEELYILISKIVKSIEEEKKLAADAVRLATEMTDRYNERQSQYLAAKTSALNEIRALNTGIESQLTSISGNCATECKTVPLPTLELHDCEEHMFGCLRWIDNHEKAVNVICMLRCEARKIASAHSASTRMKKIHVLARKYKEMTQLMENNINLLQYANQAKIYSTLAQDKIRQHDDNLEELKVLHRVYPSPMFTISTLRASADVSKIAAPCLRFQFDSQFYLDYHEEVSEEPVFCFNGEFFSNVARVMLTKPFPSTRDFFKSAEEARYLYKEVSNIERVIETTVQQSLKASKRSSVSKPDVDYAEKIIEGIAKRRIPQFTVKGDTTSMAFYHYSPWATARRSQLAGTGSFSSQNKSHSTESLEGKSGCLQTRSIVSEYRKIADSIGKASENYNYGKELFEKSKIAAKKDLAEAHVHLLNLVNETGLSSMEKGDVMYWYDYTKQGMSNYFETFQESLKYQDHESLPFMRHTMQSFYGQQDFIDHLESLGTKALKRSRIPAAKQHVSSLNVLGKKLKSLLYEKKGKIGDAAAVIREVNPELEKLQSDAMSCF